jgi:protein-tyrosine phosphatase
MMPTLPLYWIQGFTEGHLAITPAPQFEGLERAILYWKEEGVDVVVCLLERAEVPGLVEGEETLCRELDLEFLWFPIRDGSVPTSASSFDALVLKLADAVGVGKSIAIHCRAGVGRSALVATAVMTRLHIDAAAALDMVAEARKKEVPQTEEQRQWILSYRPIQLD